MLQINATNDIIINGNNTGLKVTQNANGTVVYTPENSLNGQAYKAHTMPHARYSLAHDTPASGNPGVKQFEADVLALLKRIQA